MRYLNRNFHAALLTYTLGGEVKNAEVPKRLACENAGVYKHVDEPYELGNALAEYYQYRATRENETCTFWAGHSGLGVWIVECRFGTIWDSTFACAADFGSF